MKPYWGNSGQTCKGQKVIPPLWVTYHPPTAQRQPPGGSGQTPLGHFYAAAGETVPTSRAGQTLPREAVLTSGLVGGGGIAKLCWRIIRSLLSPVYKTVTQRKLGIAVLPRQNCTWQSKGHKSGAPRMCVSACLCVCAGVCVCVCPHLHGCVHSYACMYTSVF